MCRRRCRHRRLFAHETDVLRFCQVCDTWYHVTCVAPLQTVAHYRTQNDPALPAWLTWRLPPHADRSAESGLVQLITLPIQRNYPVHFPTRMVSFEMLLTQVREDLLDPQVTFPTTMHEQVQYVQALIRRFTVPEDVSARWQALEDLVKIMTVPLTHRYLYQCPRSATHLI